MNPASIQQHEKRRSAAPVTRTRSQSRELPSRPRARRSGKTGCGDAGEQGLPRCRGPRETRQPPPKPVPRLLRQLNTSPHVTQQYAPGVHPRDTPACPHTHGRLLTTAKRAADSARTGTGFSLRGGNALEFVVTVTRLGTSLTAAEWPT